MPKQVVTREQLTQELEDLETLFPAGEPVAMGKYKVTLFPMELKGCIAFLRLMRPIIQSVLSYDQKPAGESESIADFVDRMRTAIALTISDHSDAFLDAIALGMNRDREYVNKIPPALCIPLLEAIFKLNADFFEQSLIAIAATMQATMIPPALNGLGPTQSMN